MFLDYTKCKDEQQFKMRYIRNELQSQFNKVFCIETEETVKGFPDVMVVCTADGKNVTYFYEFKVSDKSGKIKFQPTQPSFYRANPELSVRVVAYNRKSDLVHTFNANDIFSESSLYKMNERATVDLNGAELKGDYVV